MNKILTYISIFFIVTNCNLKPNIEHHGIHMLEKKTQKLKLVKLIETILLRFWVLPQLRVLLIMMLCFILKEKYQPENL